MEIMNHFDHKHPLILLRDVPPLGYYQCVACFKDLSEGEAVYGCGQCGWYILHKACAEAPREIMHPSHYQHPLVLERTTSFGGYRCSGCFIIRFGFRYYCSLCEFYLDIDCGLKENYNIKYASEKDRNLRHKGHQQHSLILHAREALLVCDACGLEKKDHFYTCTCPSCPFLLHKSCALLPETLNKCKAHNHTCDLTLSYGFPSDFKNFLYDCDVCGKRIYHWYWIYYCGPCRYFVHLECMTTEIKDDDLVLDKKYDDLLVLPASDISQELIGRFLLLKDEKENTDDHEHHDIQPSPEIKHFGHEQHPLILFHDQLPNDNNIEEEEDEEILCNACIGPIIILSSSAADHHHPHPYNYYYSCVEAGCSYFLHLSCAKLPKQLVPHHTSHHHPLTLGCHKQFYDTFGCNRCKWQSNGFFFKCETCKDFYLDVKCAAMPTSILHKTHKHPLIQYSQSPSFEDICNACGFGAHRRNMDFKCESCEFYLHYECAMLPGAIRHRFDPHPLPLRFPPYKDHPDIFICDICEMEMHPKRWLYHCSECDNSFHTKCVPRFEIRPNIKFGGILFEASSHPHPLKFVRKPTLRSNCSRCEAYIDWDMAFECEDCNFCLCLRRCILDPEMSSFSN